MGQAAAHPIQEWHKKRVARAQELVEQAARQLQEHGHEPRSVPGPVLFPLLESGSLEEDERLKNTWANLLARAGSSEAAEVLPTFPAMLARLSPKEVEILSSLYVTARTQQYLQDHEIPFATDGDGEGHGADRSMSRVYFGNFVALGICRYGPATVSASALRDMTEALQHNEIAEGKGGYRVVERFLDLDIDTSTVHLTPLGLKFLEACSPLDENQSREPDDQD